MGEESVILCRDRGGRIHVFLNSCRHRGMKVCRYDEGNTAEFLARTTAGATRTDGALVGRAVRRRTPTARSSTGRQWGLIEVPQMENYKGTIWATWDRAAPPFLDYIGGYKLYLDLLLDAWDGREGGTEVIGGIHKWLIPCNWKFPAENFSGDRYHGVSHRSVDMVGIGPSGKGRRDMQERNEARWLDVTFPDLGHSMIAFLRPARLAGRARVPGRARASPSTSSAARRSGAQRARRVLAALRRARAPCSRTPRRSPGSRARSPCGTRAGRTRPRCGASTSSTPTRRPR